MKFKLTLFSFLLASLFFQSAQAAKGSPNCEEGPYCEGPKNKDNKLDGLEICKDSKKVIRRKTQFKNGVRQGQWQCFDENAKLIETRVYVDGKLNGKTTLFQEKLNVYTSITYKDDLKDGEAVTYNTSTSNGKEVITEKIVTNYKDNDFHGWSIVYDTNGNEIKRNCFQNGNLKNDNPELCGGVKKK